MSVLDAVLSYHYRMEEKIPQAHYASPLLSRGQRRCQLFLGCLSENGTITAYRIDQLGNNRWLTPLHYPEHGLLCRDEQPWQSYNRALQEAEQDGFAPRVGVQLQPLTADKGISIQQGERIDPGLESKRVEQILRMH